MSYGNKVFPLGTSRPTVTWRAIRPAVTHKGQPLVDSAFHMLLMDFQLGKTFKSIIPIGFILKFKTLQTFLSKDSSVVQSLSEWPWIFSSTSDSCTRMLAGNCVAGQTASHLCQNYLSYSLECHYGADHGSTMLDSPVWTMHDHRIAGVNRTIANFNMPLTTCLGCRGYFTFRIVLRPFHA